jgi:hypothetical protein
MFTLQAADAARRVRGRAGLWAGVVLVALALLAGGAGGCERKPQYSQKTPDDVVASALAMVKNNDARRLADLIAADGPEMRAVLNRLGNLLSKLQELAVQVQQRMPQEVAALKAQGVNAAADSVPLGEFFEEMQRPPQRDPNDVADEGRRDVVQGAIARLFADPYGWLERNSSRMTTVKLADDIAALMVDNQPVLPPVGVTMRLEKDGKWYIVLPTNLPVVSNYMPRTREEWSIVASVIKVIENVTVELTEDVRSGRINTIKGLGDKAGDKAIIPGMIAFAAYAKEMDVRQRRDGITKSFKARLKDWTKQRSESSSGKVSASLVKVLDAVAPDQIGKLARAPRRTRMAEMSDADFTQLLQGWLNDAGVKIDLAFGVSGDEVDTEAKRWLDAETARKEAEAKAKQERRRKAGER